MQNLICLIFIGADPLATLNCTIISTSLTTLSTDGGVIVNGTQNVTIYCVCMWNNVVVGGTTWFFPNTTQIPVQSSARPGTPYINYIIPFPLFFPTFINPYAGIYSCGPYNDFTRVSSEGDNITLNIAGMRQCISNCNCTAWGDFTL